MGPAPRDSSPIGSYEKTCAGARLPAHSLADKPPLAPLFWRTPETASPSERRLIPNRPPSLDKNMSATGAMHVPFSDDDPFVPAAVEHMSATRPVNMMHLDLSAARAANVHVAMPRPGLRSGEDYPVPAVP